MKRPVWETDTRGSTYVTTPRAADVMHLLGSAVSHESVALTADEFAAIQRLYGYGPEPNTPAGRFMQAGATRNALRHASFDGMRLLAWIAKRVSPGEDPLKTLVNAAVDAGWDVDPADVEWAADDVDAEPHDEAVGE